MAWFLRQNCRYLRQTSKRSSHGLAWASARKPNERAAFAIESSILEMSVDSVQREEPVVGDLSEVFRPLFCSPRRTLARSRFSKAWMAIGARLVSERWVCATMLLL